MIMDRLWGNLGVFSVRLSVFFLIDHRFVNSFLMLKYILMTIVKVIVVVLFRLYSHFTKAGEIFFLMVLLSGISTLSAKCKVNKLPFIMNTFEIKRLV